MTDAPTDRSDMEAQRWLTMPEAYDRLCQRLVPQYDWLQTEALRLAALPDDRDTFVIDLGGGSGHFMEKVLAAHPRARACWVDASPAFEEIASRRLAPYGGRVCYVVSRFEEPWETHVGAPADLIVSMSAIHHLDSGGKADLYRRCYAALAPGGWLINVDEMATMHRDAYLASLRHWVRHVAETRAAMSAEDLPYYEVFRAHFDNWERRNVLNADALKQPGDDIHEGYVEQVAWLRQAGFVEADLYIKYHLWGLIAGRR